MREWQHPGVVIEDLPWRPTPLAATDPEWAYVPQRRVLAYVEASTRHGLPSEFVVIRIGTWTAADDD